MAMNEYRRHAAECLLLADDTTDPKNKLLLVAMAQAWLRLARRAEDTRDFVYEPQAVGKPPQSASPISDRSSTQC